MKNFTCICICIAILLGVFSGCKGEENISTETVYAMDTIMNLTVYGDNADECIEACKVELKRLEKLLSFTNPNSDVSIINSHLEQSVSSETVSILKKAFEISDLTNGYFDITVGNLVKAWGFTQDKQEVPSEETINSLLSGVEYKNVKILNNTVSIPENTAIDLGGIVKGYAGDRLVSILSQKGAKSAILSLGGNVVTYGSKPDRQKWIVEIADPNDTQSDVGSLEISGEKAIVTSGDYQRYFEQDGMRYHHILDPYTGYPASNGLSSVTVICDDGTTADALSTALFVMGKEKALELYNKNSNIFEAVFVLSNGKVEYTDGLKDIIDVPRDKNSSLV